MFYPLLNDDGPIMGAVKTPAGIGAPINSLGDMVRVLLDDEKLDEEKGFIPAYEYPILEVHITKRGAQFVEARDNPSGGDKGQLVALRSRDRGEGKPPDDVPGDGRGAW